MSIVESDFLRVASDLLARATHEAEFRSVVGRAYYSAYHRCLGFEGQLPAIGIARLPNRPQGEAGGKHETLYSRLQNPTLGKDDPRRTLSVKLGCIGAELLRLRVTADYKLAENITQSEATHAVDTANRLFALA